MSIGQRKGNAMFCSMRLCTSVAYLIAQAMSFAANNYVEIDRHRRATGKAMIGVRDGVLLWRPIATNQRPADELNWRR